MDNFHLRRLDFWSGVWKLKLQEWRFSNRKQRCWVHGQLVGNNVVLVCYFRGVFLAQCVVFRSPVF